MGTVLNAQYKSWKSVKFVEDDYLVFGEIEGIDKNNMVYLTADSDDTIENLDPTKTYIIGGIVDRNRHKVGTTLINVSPQQINHDTEYLQSQSRFSGNCNCSLTNWRIHQNGVQTSFDC
jgi:Trm5-related predicted tRNA methylase